MSELPEPARPPQEYIDALAAAERAVDEARRERDEEMRRLNAGGVTKYRLAKWFGISQQAVTKVIDAGR